MKIARVGDIIRDKNDGEEFTIINIEEGILGVKRTKGAYNASSFEKITHRNVGTLDSCLRIGNWIHVPTKETNIKKLLTKIDENK